MKAVVGVVLAMVLASAGWLGWDRYKSNEETAAAEQAVRASATLATRQLSAREKEEGITFSEYFKRSNATIEALDQEIIRLQSKDWPRRPENREVSVAFINECMSYLRADQAEMRLKLQESNSQESVDKAKKELGEADSSVAIDWATKRFVSATQDHIALLDKLIKALQENTVRVNKLLEADSSVKSVFGATAGLPEPMLKSLKDRISDSPTSQS